MQFLSLFTPAAPMPMPTPEHMEKMNALTQRELAAGNLLLTGALGHRDKVGLRVQQKGGKVTVTENPPGESVLMGAGGMAVIEAPSKEKYIEMVKEFLTVAGDGTCECLGYAFPVMTAQRQVTSGVIPSFMVDGADAASKFYQKAFGAKELQRHTMEDGKRLMHCHMEINGGSIMFNDPMPEHGYPLEPASNSYAMQLVVDDGDFWFNRAVEAGCKVLMPLEKAFWGDRYGQVTDPFGIRWGFDEPAAARKSEAA